MRIAAFFLLFALLGTVGCNRSSAEREAALLKRADRFLQSKDYTRAILELKNATQIAPDDAEPYYRLAVTYEKSGDLRSAVAALRKALERNANHTAAQLKLSELVAEYGDKELLEDSAQKLRKIVGDSPDNAEALEALAITELRLGDRKSAEERLHLALLKFPANLKPYVSLAKLELDRKDPAAAEATLKKAVATMPQTPEAALALGEFYMSQRKLQQAEAEVRRGLQLNRTYGQALLDLGEIQLAAGRITDADGTYQAVAALPDRSFRSLHALYLFNYGDKSRAIAELEKLARENSDDRDVRRHLLMAYLGVNRIVEAEKLIANALNRNSNDSDALLARGLLSLKRGKPTDAEADLTRIIRSQPNSALLHLALGATYSAQGLSKSARSELNRAVQLDPRVLPARIALAKNYRAAGDLRAALDTLENATADERTSAWTAEHNWALLASGNQKQFRQDLDRALSRERSPEFLLQDAAARIIARDFAGARASAEEILKSSRGDIRAARLVADAYISQQQDGNAIERIRQLTVDQPKSAAFQHLLGQLYARSGKNEQAAKAFETAAALDPGDLTAALALGEFDLKQGRIDSAYTRLKKLTTDDPQYADALLLLAQAEEAKGLQQNAAETYRSVLALDSSNLIALNNLAYLLIPTSLDEALKLAEAAGELAPADPNVQDTLGWIYYRKGLYRRAVEHLRVAVDRARTPRRQFHLGTAYLKMGDRRQGQALLASALQQDARLAQTEREW